jgi:hypothetical protein
LPVRIAEAARIKDSTGVVTTHGPGSIAITSCTVPILSRSALGSTRPSFASAPSVAGANAESPTCRSE